MQAVTRLDLIEQEVDVLTHRLIVFVVRLNRNDILTPVFRVFVTVFVVKVAVSVLLAAAIGKIGATELVENEDTRNGATLLFKVPL